MSRKNTALIVILAVSAALPRLWFLSSLSITSDESRWVMRGTDYVRNFFTGQFQQATRNFVEHPGIPAALLIGSFCAWENWERQNHWEFTDMWNQRGNNLLLQQYIAVARLPIALIGTLNVILLYLLVRHLDTSIKAYWAALLLAFSPFHLALSRIAHQDAALTFFFSMAILCYCVAEKEKRLGLKMTAGVFWGLAFLTKILGFIVLPILFAAKTSCMLRQKFAARRQKDHTINFDWGDLLFLICGLVVFITLYPDMWHHTLSHLVGHFRSNMGVAKDHSLYFFMGKPTYDAPWYYYLVNSAMRLTPISLIFLLAGCWQILIFSRRKRETSFYLLTIVIWIVVVIGLMSLSEKKGDRYVLPIWPALMIVAAQGVSWAGSKLKGPAKRLREGSITYAMTFLLVVASVYPILHFFPNYYLYYNTWFGGPRKAKELVLFSWGEGLKEAMEYIKNQYGPDKKITICGYVENARYHYPGKVSSLDNNLTAYDYLLVEINALQRLPDQHWLIDYVHSYLPEHVVTVNGVDVIWIYDTHAQYSFDRVIVSEIKTDREKYHIFDPITVQVHLHNQDRAHSHKVIVSWIAVASDRLNREYHKIAYLNPGQERELLIRGQLPRFPSSQLRVKLRIPDLYYDIHPDIFYYDVSVSGWVTIGEIYPNKREFIPGEVANICVRLRNCNHHEELLARVWWFLTDPAVEEPWGRTKAGSARTELEIAPEEEREIILPASVPMTAGDYRLSVWVQEKFPDGFIHSDGKWYENLLHVKQ